MTKVDLDKRLLGCLLERFMERAFPQVSMQAREVNCQGVAELLYAVMLDSYLTEVTGQIGRPAFAVAVRYAQGEPEHDDPL